MLDKIVSLDDLSKEVYVFAEQLMDDGAKPYAIAAIFTMIALQIYKTSMSPEEYNAMVDAISDSRDMVKRLDYLESGESSEIVH